LLLFSATVGHGTVCSLYEKSETSFFAPRDTVSLVFPEFVTQRRDTIRDSWPQALWHRVLAKMAQALLCACWYYNNKIGEAL